VIWRHSSCSGKVVDREDVESNEEKKKQKTMEPRGTPIASCQLRKARHWWRNFEDCSFVKHTPKAPVRVLSFFPTHLRREAPFLHFFTSPLHSLDSSLPISLYISYLIYTPLYRYRLHHESPRTHCHPTAQPRSRRYSCQVPGRSCSLPCSHTLAPRCTLQGKNPSSLFFVCVFPEQ